MKKDIKKNLIFWSGIFLLFLLLDLFDIADLRFEGLLFLLRVVGLFVILIWLLSKWDNLSNKIVDKLDKSNKEEK